MAQNDIYNHKRDWEGVISKIEDGSYLVPSKNGFYIKNKENIRYFRILINELEFKDISYIRRINYVCALKKTCTFTDKDLKDITREDVKEIIRKSNETCKSRNARLDFLTYNKTMWRMLFPEKDAQGRPDEMIVPYPWRLKIKVEKTKAPDRLTIDDHEKIMNALKYDPMIRLFTSMLYLNYARPQELCYIDIEDIEMFESFARIKIEEHSKETPKELQLVDNYQYLLDWLEVHPEHNKGNKKAPLFINHYNQRLTDFTVNDKIKKICKTLNINKHITCYSFKRAGITHARLRGDPDQDIQKRAGWTTTKQLKNYDQSNQYDYFEKELREKGVKRVQAFRKQDDIQSIKEELRDLKEAISKLSHIDGIKM